jgi:hypothetical protein
MRASLLPFRLACAAVAALALLGAPADALAHRGSPASVASDYEAHLTGARPAVSGLTTAVTGGDIDLVLHVPAGRTIVVLGVEGEPFLRFRGGVVFANERSPTAGSARVVTLSSSHVGGPPAWKEVHRGLSFRWHEQRLRPAFATHNGVAARISIPLLVDGTRTNLVGTSTYAAAPNPLTWLLPLLLVAVAAGLSLRRRERLMPRLLLPLGVVAVASVIVSVAGWTLYAPHTRLGAIVEIGAAGLLGGAALAALVLVRDAHRAFAATVTGGLCVLFATTSLPVLTHGFVLSRVPAGLARAAAIGAIAAGGWLLLMGAAGLYEQSTRRSPPGRRVPARRTAHRPRGRQS